LEINVIPKPFEGSDTHAAEVTDGKLNSKKNRDHTWGQEYHVVDVTKRQHDQPGLIAHCFELFCHRFVILNFFESEEVLINRIEWQNIEGNQRENLCEELLNVHRIHQREQEHVSDQ